MIEDLNGIIVEVQSCQIRRVLEQIPVQRVDVIVAQVQRLQSYFGVCSVNITPLEYLAS